MEECQQFAFNLAFDSPLIGTVKNDRTLMVFNFFALARERQTELPTYDDGRVRIEVSGTKHGVANVWDKELLIYIASLMVDRMNRGESVTPEFNFTAHDFFRITGTKPAGTAYGRIEESLDRLQSTQIKTNALDDDDERGGSTKAFSWIDDYDIRWRKTKGGDRIMRSVYVKLGAKLFNTILKHQKMLTYDPRYFQLSPLEKRLYEIARAHCGHQKGIKMNIEKLRLRVGTGLELRYFKRELKKIQNAKKSPLPEYGLMLVDPRAKRALDAKQPNAPGRTPLKSYLVFFFRTDKLAGMPLVDQVPLIDDDDPLSSRSAL